jgi:hypothetical protein
MIGPDPISPFVLLAASIDSIDHFNFDIHFARATMYDQDTLNQIEQIFSLHADEALTADWLIQLAKEVQVHVSIV